MKQSSLVLPLMAVAFFAGAAMATETPAAAAPSATALSPASALSLALAHDARYQAAKANFRSESQAVNLVRSGLLPSVAVNVNRTYNQLHPEPGRQQDYVSAATGIALRQAVYRPETRALVDEARAELMRQEALLASERSRLSLEVATAYFEALRAHADAQAQQIQQQALAGLVTAAQRAQPLGLGSATMVQEREAKAAQGQLRILQAQIKRAEAVAHLERLTGQPVRTLLTVPDEGFAWPRETSVAPLGDWQERARSQSPEVQAAQAAVQTAKLALVRQQAARLPTLDLVLGRNRVASETPTSVNSRYTNTTIGLQLAVPLYDGGRNTAATAQAVADLERATAQLDHAQRDLDGQVESAWRQLTQAPARLEAHHVVVAAARQAVLAARQGQQRGQQSALDVLDAQSQLEAARLEQHTTQLQLLLTRVRLQVLAGADDWLGLAPLQPWLVRPVAIER